MSEAQPGTGFSVDEEALAYDGKVVALYNVTMVDPAGGRHPREVARHPGAVAVVPLIDDRVILIRQYRVAIDQELLELPAGKLDVAGEANDAAAQRELIEEVGYRAERLERLGSIYNSAGFCDEEITIYLGTDLVEVPRATDGAEEQWSEIVEVPLARIAEMVSDGSLTDAKTLIGLQWMLQRHR